MNIRCKCEWCESWNQGFEPWIIKDFHPSHPQEYIDKAQAKWRDTYTELNNERLVFETYSKEDLLKMTEELLQCSGEFDSSPVHSLCFAVKQLLENK